jgi:integrase
LADEALGVGRVGCLEHASALELNPVCAAEVDALFGALRTQRDRAMVEAMVLGGLRRCEVLGLRLSDLMVGQRRVFIVAGKGGHQRVVPMAPVVGQGSSTSPATNSDTPA